MNAIGAPISRVDGRAKLTGTAHYAADFDAPRLAHAVLVQSSIAKGRISGMRTERAAQAPGVLLVMTHANAPKLPSAPANPPSERNLSLLQDDAVRYNGEPVAVVVAESLEQAQQAAKLVDVLYAEEKPVLDFVAAKSSAYTPREIPHGKADLNWGDADGALHGAVVTHAATYATPMESHNPMEPHATLAAWDGDELTVHDATQYVMGVRNALSKKLGVPQEKIHVLSPYLGGGFGCKGSAWSHVVLAAMAAREVHRPVRLALERTQMFGPVGYRPRTEQRIALAADREGKLIAIKHEVVSPTSTFEDWTEPSTSFTRMIYACANGATSQRLVKLNLGTPTFQRAPGLSTGSYAMEAAMDEIAQQLGIDPLELRLRNYADAEPSSGKPFSSKKLRECYRDAAQRFGWAQRKPRGERRGNTLVGYGMATAAYPAHRMPANARVRLRADGSALVQTCTQDLGTGTYTIVAQVAADTLGLPVDRIQVEIGDSVLPEAPVSGGSMTAASVTPAVQAAAQQVREKLIAFAIADAASPLRGSAAADLETADGWLRVRDIPGRSEPFAAIMARNGGPIEATANAKLAEEDENKYAMHSFGAVFAEVAVDADLHEVRVPRIVATYSVGRVLNAKTAHSQLVGGIVWGLGMALTEETLVDPQSGRVLNANLAQYHVPVNADIGDIDVTFVEEDDRRFNPLGARGIGELGITGVPAAIANAVYHATGRRIRDLPITPDKLLAA